MIKAKLLVAGYVVILFGLCCVFGRAVLAVTVAMQSVQDGERWIDKYGVPLVFLVLVLIGVYFTFRAAAPVANTVLMSINKRADDAYRLLEERGKTQDARLEAQSQTFLTALAAQQKADAEAIEKQARITADAIRLQSEQHAQALERQASRHAEIIERQGRLIDRQTETLADVKQAVVEVKNQMLEITTVTEKLVKKIDGEDKPK